MNSITQLLSSFERSLLEADIKLMALAIKYISIALPVLIIFAIASWYYDWHGMLKFLTTGVSVVLLVAFIACLVQTDRVRMDLKANTKMIVNYKLLEKYAEGYVTPHHQKLNSQKTKERVTVSEDAIKEAIQYQLSQKTNAVFPSDHYEQILNYSYNVKVLNLGNGKEEQFLVPIESYIKVQSGQNILISYALNSQKVFDMK